MTKIYKVITLFFLINSCLFGQQEGSYIGHQGPCLSESKRLQIKENLANNIANLGLNSFNNNSIVSFNWPLQAKPELEYKNYYCITNYVDHEVNVGPNAFNQFSGSNLDYDCGNHTYDLNSGYNHSGTDIATWPFDWYIFQNGLVDVVAAAAGVVIGKDDGNVDDNCGNFIPGANWNAVYIQHTDGSVAWYGHLQNGSLTTKTVGQTVAQGEYLGLLGSSGQSTGPHLHFEVYDQGNNLIDPFSGTCNSLNAASWWANQLPYKDPGTNVILTHSNIPEFGCAVDEQPNFQDCFVVGETVYIIMYHRGAITGDNVNLNLLDPNNATYVSSNGSYGSDFNCAYYSWSYTLPATGPFGTWTIEGTFNGETCSQTFEFRENSCEDCPTDIATSTAPAVDVVDSTCPTGQMTPSGGLINAPISDCPTGSTIEYSTDGGTNWVTTLPVYDQMNAITVLTRCNCDVDTNVSSMTSSVTTMPATCEMCPANLATSTAPAVDVVDSTCPTGQMTPSGGLINAPISDCPTGSTIEYSTDGGTNWVTTLPVYDQMNAITVLTRCNCDVDTNVSSMTSSVTTMPTTCDELALMLSDPCNCDGGFDSTGSGINDFASETITITPGTAPYTTTSVTDLYDNTGVALNAIDIDALITAADPGNGQPFDISVFVLADGATLFTLSIMDNAGASDAITAATACSCSQPPVNDIPTLSEWGLITLALLLMTYGSLKLVGSITIAGVNNLHLPIPNIMDLQLPFNHKILFKSLALTAILIITGFTICFAIYNQIFLTDIFGMLIAGPIFIYLMHLLYLIEKSSKK